MLAHGPDEALDLGLEQVAPCSPPLARRPRLRSPGFEFGIVWDTPTESVDRPWFACPVCGRRCRFLFLRDRIACRQCFGLQHPPADARPWAAWSGCTASSADAKNDLSRLSQRAGEAAVRRITTP